MCENHEEFLWKKEGAGPGSGTVLKWPLAMPSSRAGLSAGSMLVNVDPQETRMMARALESCPHTGDPD